MEIGHLNLMDFSRTMVLMECCKGKFPDVDMVIPFSEFCQFSDWATGKVLISKVHTM